MEIGRRMIINPDYIWNTIAGLFNAAEAVFMCMIVTRTSGLFDAGILTIAFAVGNIIMTIGKFGVRNFQVTDTEKQYKFQDYLVFRAVTIFLMLVSSCGYLYYSFIKSGYSVNKIIVIAFVIAIYVVETFEDVVWGEYQVKGYLARGAQLFCFRWGSIFISFLIMMVFTENIILSLLVSFIISLGVFLIAFIVTYHKLFGSFSQIRTQKVNMKKMRQLFYSVAPLFGVSFLTFYVNNAPKYAIDGMLSEEIQACYGFIAMPVFVIGLLNNFIYQPTLVRMAQEWNNKQYFKVKESVKRQIIILLVITVGIFMIGRLCGIEVLSLLYATNLDEYRIEFYILLLTGFWLALSGYFGVILTIMRYQRDLLTIYIVAALLAFGGLRKSVELYGVMGAVLGYTVLIIIIVIMSGLDLYIRIRNSELATCQKQNKGEKN